MWTEELAKNAKTSITVRNIKIKSSLYSRYYAEACNELRGPSPQFSAWATQLRRNITTVASRWRHCVDLTGQGIEPQTSRTDSVRLATELTAGRSKHRRKNTKFTSCDTVTCIFYASRMDLEQWFSNWGPQSLRDRKAKRL